MPNIIEEVPLILSRIYFSQALNKNRFKILLAVMSIALISLILLQYFWIRNVHQLTEDRFKEDVTNSLEKTARDLEKIEMAPLLQQELFESGLQGSYADFVNREFGDVMRVDESIQIRDTVISKNGQKYQFLVVSGTTIDTATGLLAEHRIITKRLGDIIPSDVESSVLSFRDSNSYAIQLNNSFNRQIMRKAHYLDEIMVKMFTGNYFDDIALRLDVNVLDSLLRYNFMRNGLDTNYRFNVIHKGGKTPNFVRGSLNFDPNLKFSEFKTLLFPNDIVEGEYDVVVTFPNESSYLWKEMSGTLTASVLLVLIIVFAFYLAMSTIYNQKQLSEIKNDFISNMTHELKTPISTISLACEAIRDPDVASDESTLNGFVSMIDQENKRLAKLVENVLQTALLEKGKMSLKMSEVRVDNLVREIVHSFQIRFKDKNGIIQIDHLDELTTSLDRIHFGNVIYNLLDNALKYCAVAPMVNIKLVKSSNGFQLFVKDNGIGIKKDEQKRIFEKLYRVPTGDIHNVKGFGLGLNYVDSIVKLHGGEITVESSANKGSTFKIKIEK